MCTSSWARTNRPRSFGARRWPNGRRPLPADYEADKVNELDAQLKNLKRRTGAEILAGYRANRSKLRMTARIQKRSVRLPAFAKINLCLHVVGKPPGRLSRAAHDFPGDFAARHAGTFARRRFRRRIDFTLESNDPTLPLGSGKSGVSRSGSHPPRNRISQAACMRAWKREFRWRADWAADRATPRRRSSACCG